MQAHLADPREQVARCRWAAYTDEGPNCVWDQQTLKELLQKERTVYNHYTLFCPLHQSCRVDPHNFSNQSEIYR